MPLECRIAKLLSIEMPGSSSGHNCSIGLQDPLAHLAASILGWAKGPTKLPLAFRALGAVLKIHHPLEEAKLADVLLRWPK